MNLLRKTPGVIVVKVAFHKKRRMGKKSGSGN
jgi:hypothetical protein